VLRVPLTGSDPLHAPDAAQAVALVEDQVNVELPPLATLVGPALKETLGRAADAVTVAFCDAVPPLPVQVKI
jgi:hypothetical protein